MWGRCYRALALGAALALAGCGETTVTPRSSTPVIYTSAIGRPAPAPKRKAKTHAATKRSPSGSPVGAPSLAHMIGQTIVGRFAGSGPPASFLDQIRSGELGGVILYSENVAGGETATRQLDEQLQRAAKEGGNPPLLIMTDQEGGEVKRLAWAPPELAAAEMASSTIAQSEGEATGRALRSVGINVDLAPVADVIHVAGSFLGRRSFGANPRLVAERACGFAAGIASQGVAYTLKHFPGLGRAMTSTDVQPTTVNATAKLLRSDYVPYVDCGNNPNGLVMINSAIYPSLTGTSTPAVLSPKIYETELPLATSGHPVTISDDLQSPALANEVTPAQRAINAGLDILLYATTQKGSTRAFQGLLAAAASGSITRPRLEQADRAIQGLKERVAGALPPSAPAGAEATASQAVKAGGTGIERIGGEANPESAGAREPVKPEVQTETGAQQEK
jgi:beta-N-acetylhexosaminidase